MTIVPFHRLLPCELQHLGTNITDAIRQDHEELAQDRSLAAIGEHIDWDLTHQGDTACD